MYPDYTCMIPRHFKQMDGRDWFHRSELSTLSMSFFLNIFGRLRFKNDTKIVLLLIAKDHKQQHKL